MNISGHVGSDPLQALDLNHQERASAQNVQVVEATGYIEASGGQVSTQSRCEEFCKDLSLRKSEKKDVITNCDLINISDWSEFLSSYPDSPDARFGRIEGDIKKGLWALWKKFEDYDYQGVVVEGRQLITRIQCSVYPTSVVNYVNKLILLSEILDYQDDFDPCSLDCQFPRVASMVTKDQYIEFCLGLADAARMGTDLIPESAELERVCLYKASDAGCDLAKRILIKEMFFGRRDEDAPYESSLFFPPEGLELLMTLPSDSRLIKRNYYDDVIDGLKSWFIPFLSG